MTAPVRARPDAPLATARAGGWGVNAIVWPAVGLAAVALSSWLLVHQLRDVSWGEVQHSFAGISGWRWLFAGLCTLLAYAALAWYDGIALAHLGVRLPWRFISAVSFTTYALSHNVGMSIMSGAVVRYRAYASKGLSIGEIGILVAFCSFTFALGTAMLGGIACLTRPEILSGLLHLPRSSVRVLGLSLLGVVVLYACGSLLNLKPLRIGQFTLSYPRLTIALRQLVAGPLELLGAAGIIYCALPPADHAGFLSVLAVFLASFSAALLSHAPGGIGVLELVFLTAMPHAPRADVLAALLVFRLLYLVAPLGIGIPAIILFERSRILQLNKDRSA